MSDCDHHWHAYAGTKEVEVKTSNPPWVPATCCHCGATAHIKAGDLWCGFKAREQPALEHQRPLFDVVRAEP